MCVISAIMVMSPRSVAVGRMIVTVNVESQTTLPVDEANAIATGIETGASDTDTLPRTAIQPLRTSSAMTTTPSRST